MDAAHERERGAEGLWRVRRLPVFVLVGGVSTLVYGLGYLVLRTAMDPHWANGVALVGSTLLATDGHRRFTFDVHAHRTAVPHQALGLLVLALGLVATSASLSVLEARDPDAGAAVEVAVLAAVNLGVGLVRFALFAAVMRDRPPG